MRNHKKEGEPQNRFSFIPTTRQEMDRLGWDCPDIILVTGDTYIDSPHIGAAVIGRVLLDAGYRVGIIAQPDMDQDQDITRLGEPLLFWGVTGGSVDSMIANKTASNKPRRKDDLTPGGQNTRRPDRAAIAYSNLIRRYFKNTVPIVLGGIEASLRRVSHYDAWSNNIRRSILFDAKADVLVYGMGEKTILELAEGLRGKKDYRHVRGLCYIDSQPPGDDGFFNQGDMELPGHTVAASDKEQFARMFSAFYANNDPRTAKRLYQQQDTRYLIHNPPQWPLTQEELDGVFELPYVHEVHPYYAAMGKVSALDTIQFSLTTHRGCFGECRFCAIAVHQGRQVISRTKASLVREAVSYASHQQFKGIISNVGGPTANMYAMTCNRIATKGACSNKSCLFPTPCRSLQKDHGPQIQLFRALGRIPGVRKAFLGSGLRHDLVVADEVNGQSYLEEVLRNHASGQLKIAPEHVADEVLALMGKPGQNVLEHFLKMFESIQKKSGEKIFLTYYLMAAHPGCTLSHMNDLRAYSLKRLKMLPEQVQIFTPSPSTYATLMYHTEKDPFSGRPIPVEKNAGGKEKQKAVMNKQKHFTGAVRKNKSNH
ncbi:MAG: YgiQ family radical SAM protein [Proteobacteria bacterium]|nr:YgiQ family radical SAM protein [Pseudomonadota bacterium]MBU4469703.1 YgiQ family radical SAM protein [Pseudomonadota bacterium]MCG2751785.1 YgiQ family radical SAM protein [Desulfobacteraceae bacterium]